MLVERVLTVPSVPEPNSMYPPMPTTAYNNQHTNMDARTALPVVGGVRGCTVRCKNTPHRTDTFVVQLEIPTLRRLGKWTCGMCTPVRRGAKTPKPHSGSNATVQTDHNTRVAEQGGRRTLMLICSTW